MSINRIVVITCILLAIFTMGAVGASDINGTSDSLSLSDDDSLNANVDSDAIAAGPDKSFKDLNDFIEGSAEGDEIKLDYDYAFNETSDSGFSNGISISKQLTIDGQNHTIDAKYSARIFNIESSGIVILRNINFVNATADDYGGAVRGSSFVCNCSFANCFAENGGAVGVNADDIVVLDCSFINCSSTNEGGAVDIGGNVSGCSFVNCYSGSGGAIAIGGAVSNSTFINCSALNNGGGAIWSDSGDVFNCTFKNCSSAGGFAVGGAIYSPGGHGAISRCTFIDCYSDGGGAIYLPDSTEDVIGCSFVNCSSSNGLGGAISGDANISGCSFVNCSAPNGEGGAIFGDGNVSGCSFRDCYSRGPGAVCCGGNVFNCTFERCYSSNSRGGAVYCDGNVFNCSFVNCHVLNEDVGGAVGSNGVCNVFDCSFENCSASNYGGAVGINDGNVSGCSFVNCSTPNGEGGAITIFYNGAISGCSFADCFARWGGAIRSTNCTVSDCSFVNCSAESGGAILIFDGGGAFDGNCNISGCSFVDCFAQSAGAIGGSGVFSDCNFTNCSASDGGAIFGNGVFSNCIFTNCSSVEGSGAIGTENAAIAGCSFVNCSASHAGAIGVGNAADIVGCSFVDCSTPNGNGGAISGANITISNSIFMNCSAEYGGAIADGGNSSVLNCSFTGCYAKNHGGVIFSDCIHDVISGCNFTDCRADDCGGAVVLIQSNDGFISDCNFVNCSSRIYGGAISWQGIGGKVSGCSFIDCYSIEGDGGSIWTECGGLTIENSQFVRNSANNSMGGAIYLVNTTCIVNSTFDENRAVEGNAIWADNKTEVTFSSNTFRLASGQSRYDLIRGVGEDVLKANEIYSNGRLVVTPQLSITFSDLVLGESEKIVSALPGDATGRIRYELLKDGNAFKNNSYKLSNATRSRTYSDLGLGVYNITISYMGDENYYETSASAIFMVRPAVNITQGATVGDNVAISMHLKDAAGRMVLYIDGEVYLINKINDTTGILSYDFSTYDLGFGNHNIFFEYLGSSFNKDIFSRWDGETYIPFNYTLSLKPIEVTVDDNMGSNDAGVVVIQLPEDATGTIEVFINGVICDVVEVVNGIARIDLSQFKDGNYIITFAYSGDSRYSAFTKESVTDVHNNVPDSISAGDFKMVYASGKSYSVTVLTKTDKGVSGVVVTFYANGVAFASAKTNANGVASVAVSLAPGSYTITSQAQSASAVRMLKVTHLVSLKKVSVKRSAKRLVLTANLAKVNGKYLKGKKITFRFNGKKYAAKTNKKGVAKVSVKSSVLKKLKVGKNVKYQATYLKDTVKYSVKIKK